MNKVIFVPRSVAATLVPHVPSALISIRDHGELPLEVSSRWTEVLRLAFHDSDTEAPGQELFSEAQARQVLEFVRRNADRIDELVVHCLAGQSRSAAVALFIAEALGKPCYKQGLPVTPASYALYNRYVYRTLLRVAHEHEDGAFLEWAANR